MISPCVSFTQPLQVLSVSAWTNSTSEVVVALTTLDGSSVTIRIPADAYSRDDVLESGRSAAA